MPRAPIPKTDYAAILRQVDCDKVPVATVAGHYGVVSRTIYIVLAKARAAAAGPASTDDAATPAADMCLAAEDVVSAPADMTLPARQAARQPEPLAVVQPAAVEDRTSPARRHLAEVPSSGRDRSAIVQPLAKTGRASSPGAGATRLRTAYGLVIRPEDGEEAVVPYGSLEELLAGIRPILRETARQGGDTWFAIREVDHAMLDEMREAG